MTTDQLNGVANHIESLAAILTSLTGLMVAIPLFLTAFIGVASILARFTPKPAPGTWRHTYHKWLNVVAMNTGHAANKDD